MQLQIMLPVDICAVTVQQLLACWNQTIWTRCTWWHWLWEDGRRGRPWNSNRAVHIHNEATSCIPAKLCKWGMVGIHSAEDSGPVSFASNALNGFGPIIVCLRTQTAQWQCKTQTDPFAWFICMQLYRKARVAFPERHEEGLTRLSIIMVQIGLHPLICAMFR